MPAKNQTCYAFIQLPGSFEWVICGVLNVNDVGQNAYRGIFQYGRSYLARQNVPSLDPYNLPLSDRPQEFTKLRGIPGALRDASPDAWGRRVIQAKRGLQEADLSEVDYLLNGPDDGAGNLRFGPSTKPPTAARPFNRTHQLRALTDATQTLEESGKLAHEVLEQLEPGTSMGGARPKVSIEDNNTIWLAKLPEKNDKLNMQRIEYATLELARFAGLDVCETRLEKVGGRDALLLARFDRQWHPDAKAYARFGMVSALTVLDAEDGYLGRDRWSYLLLADELHRWSSHPEKDQLELFRRMVFNAMVTNNDDHPRNHALLQVQGAWRLSPAYDIVPVPAMSKERRDLALQVGAFGRSASVYNLLSQPEVFGLSAQGARAEIDRMREKVSHWQAIFKKYGVCEVDIVAIAPAMLPQSFERIEPPGPI
ncbi:type II toxin-antitoxin system HipA family toxin [Limnohabitans sp. Rim8]|uniref:type II toxin-antitoxin system HipA family toxin n=1 Tax=Limnohabitans sp. Rim8 TaxID=1100718 RepID=UPI0026181196|nr:HipA domain-containing protein [Limnohabitans sp. Rim8]